MKTILLILHDDPGQPARLRAAIDLVRAVDGEIHCLDVTRVPHLVTDYYSQAGRRLWSDDARFAESENRKQVQRILSDEAVRWRWRDVEGDISECVVEAADLADIIVANSHFDADDLSAQSIIGAILVNSLKPILAVPEEARGFSAAGKALVAWDGSHAVGNMLRAAIPVLQFASAVRLHTVTPDADVVSVEEAAQYLSRHGIHPIITTQHDPDHAVDALLRIACGTWHAAYCLMGAYGRSRLSEAVFGGTTCGMLKHSRIPLLLGR